MTRMFPIREPSVDALMEAPVYFRYGSNKRLILVDKLTADALLTCHDALGNTELKNKFARMVSGSPAQLQKLVTFCWKYVKITHR